MVIYFKPRIVNFKKKMQNLLVFSSDPIFSHYLKVKFDYLDCVSVIETSSFHEDIPTIKSINPQIVFIDTQYEKIENLLIITKFVYYNIKAYIVLFFDTDDVGLCKLFSFSKPLFIVNKDLDDPYTQFNLTNLGHKFTGGNNAQQSIVKSFLNEHEHIPFTLRKVILYIENNIESKMTVEELAEISGWNRYHFTRMFIRYLKLSPYHYVVKKRLEYAQELLLNSNLPINEIAKKLNFKSHTTFTNTFRKHNNISPEKFRLTYRLK